MLFIDDKDPAFCILSGITTNSKSIIIGVQWDLFGTIITVVWDVTVLVFNRLLHESAGSKVVGRGGDGGKYDVSIYSHHFAPKQHFVGTEFIFSGFCCI